MAAIKYSFSLMLVFLVFSFSLFILEIAAVDFHEWCQRTRESDICISVIQADPRANLKTTPSGFCAILRDKSKKVSMATASKIAGLRRNRGNSPAVIQALRTCAGLYDKAISDLNKLDYSVLNHANYKTLSDATGVVFEYPFNCEAAFKKPTPSPSPLTAENLNLQNIILTIIDTLNLNECNKVSLCQAKKMY